MYSFTKQAHILDHEFLFQTLSDSDKKLLEKTKRILSSLGSYLKMELTNVDHQMKVFVKHTNKKQIGRNWGNKKKSTLNKFVIKLAL